MWPETHRQRALLTMALELAAADPPPILAVDVIDVLPGIAGTPPAGQPRVVFHSATRLHVPADRLAAFDAAIERAGDSGPLWWPSVEDAPGAQARDARRGCALQLRRPGAAAAQTIAIVDGHLAWIEAAPGASSRPGRTWRARTPGLRASVPLPDSPPSSPFTTMADT